MSTTYILGQPFEVSFPFLTEDTAGESDACNRTIKVDCRLSSEVRTETYYHEVAHMWLDLGGYSAILGENLSEALCQFLGVALMQFMEDNDCLPKISEEQENE